MKHIMLSLLAVLVVFSCQKDKMELTATETIRGLFPTEYQSNQDIYFVNALNEQKRLVCFYEEKEFPSLVVGSDDIVKQFGTLLYEEDGIHPLILIAATNSDDHENADDYSLRFSLNPFGQAEEGFCMLRLSMRDGELSNWIVNEFDSELDFDFSEITFIDVYSDTNENSEGYSQIFYNIDFGIVAFRDASDELWVYSHAE